jgi:hypothetical protein
MIGVKSKLTGLVSPTLTCAISGEEIDDFSKANAEWVEVLGLDGQYITVREPVAVLKKFSFKHQLASLFNLNKDTGEKLRWQPLDVFLIQLCLGGKLDYEEALRKAELLSRV